MMEYKIITGTAQEVEDKLNSKLAYRRNFESIKVISMAATDNQTTILISINR